MPFEKWNIKHHNEAEKDTAKVIKLLDRLILEIATYLYSMKIEEGIFKFNSSPALNKKVEKLLEQYNFSIQASIDRGIVKHWELSNVKNDSFLKKALKKYDIKDSSIATRNAEGLQAFRNRRNKEISNRVWRQGKQLRNELEMAIDTAIKDGTPANQLATEIKKYLKQPDKLFRRYRDNNGQLQLSKNALSYNPGQGVYRSSYKNAERLARTEINMAYRLADIERWQDLDFIVGYEIKRSKHPYPCTICEMMAGKYPKDFVWSGNHPNCRCYLVPIFKDDTDNVEINPKFTKWVLQNEQKIQRAKSLPYFLRDNREYWKDKLSPKNQISVLDGRNTVLSRKVIKIEEEIRMNKSFETAVLVNSDGDILIDKRGKSTSVEFTQNECLMMKNGILTHNHPLGWRYNENELGRIGNSFSKADLSMAIAHDLAEIRAVTPLYTFSMKRPDKGWGIIGGLKGITIE